MTEAIIDVIYEEELDSLKLDVVFVSFKSGDRVFPNASVLEKVNSNIRIELHKSELGNGIVKALVFDGIDEVAVWE